MPELCYLAEMDEEIRSNYKTMKSITQFTQIKPP